MTIHECATKKGIITDVTFNDFEIHCKGCGKALREDQVNPHEFYEIQKIWTRGRENDSGRR